MNAVATSSRTGAEAGDTNAELGMWVFLATEVLFFGVLFFGYTVTRLHHPQAFAQASRHTDIVLGSINTAVLLTSSLAMALAGRSAQSGNRRATVWLLAATFTLGLLFLSLKLLEYAHDYHEHLVPWLSFALHGADQAGMRQFFMMYFITTGAHAVHLSVGLTLVAVMMGIALRSKQLRKHSHAIEITGLYWHLVDMVWIFLYPLLYLVSRA
jgi:cytochrome c oxidase subunit III